MARTHRLTVTLPSDREIKLVRSFDAPRALVWKAMTTPDLLRQWWGPHGTTVAACDMDLRPGGSWRLVVRFADGSEHPFKGVYREIDPGERLVQTWVYDLPPFNQYESIETMTLEERDGCTTLTTMVLHQSKEARDGHVQSGMEGGASQTFERLDAVLASLPR